MSDAQSDFERGHSAGYNAAEMDEFRRHFIGLNGSVEKTGEALTELTGVVRDQGEAARVAAASVKAAADAVVLETERVRKALEDKNATGDRRFTRSDRIVGIVIALALLALAVQASGLFG